MNVQMIETKQPPKTWHSFFLDKADTVTVLELCQMFGAKKSEFFRQAIRNEIKRLKAQVEGQYAQHV